MQILQNTYTCFTGTCHIVIKSYSSSFMKYKEEKRPIKRNLDGWIYFFYSKFKKITCLLISWSTNKHIDTNIRYLKKKYLAWIFDKFWIIAEVMGTTWTKHYCWYKKEGKVFHMMPYNQVTGKLVRTCFALIFYLWSK